MNDGYGSIAKNAIVDMRDQGRTYQDIARSLGINLRTIRAWMDQYQCLKDAVADADKFIESAAEHSLIQLALGYYGIETKVFHYQGEIITHDVTRWYPPNPKALEFLLKNVNPDKWQDKKEVSLTSSLPTVGSFQEASTIMAADPTLIAGDKD